MTPDEVLALPVTTDLMTACRAWGIGQSDGYGRARRNELPFPVQRLGRKYVVVTSDLIRSLGIEAGAASAA